MASGSRYDYIFNSSALYLPALYTGILYDPTAVKAQLIELVRAHKPLPLYMAAVIGIMYGHTIIYTPPYHPELQPIELIWGQLKNSIASAPARNIAELEAKLEHAKLALPKRSWTNKYRHVQKVEDKYLDAVDTEEIAGLEEDNVEEISSLDDNDEEET